MVPLELVGVRVEIPANTPMVLLHEQDGRPPAPADLHRQPRGVGDPLRARRDRAPSSAHPRPVREHADRCSAPTLDQVVVTEVRDRTYYAELHLKTADGERSHLAHGRPMRSRWRSAARRRSSRATICSTRSARSRRVEVRGRRAEIIDEFKDFIERRQPRRLRRLMRRRRPPPSVVFTISQSRSYARVTRVRCDRRVCWADTASEAAMVESNRVAKRADRRIDPSRGSIGYSGTQTAKVVGITYRQLDYWARTDLIRPSLTDAAGSGSRRRYSYNDLLELKSIKTLLDAGIKLESVREVFELPPRARRRPTSPPPTSSSTVAASCCATATS